MSSARLPEHGDATLLGIAPAPPSGLARDTTPAGLFAAPALAAHPPHLVPCVACGALNGRSALACWSCEADLIGLAPFARPGAKRLAEPPPAAADVTVTTEAAEVRRGLHLVSRVETPVSIEPAPAMPAPADLPVLPVLTALVEGAAPSEDATPVPASPPLKTHRPDRPMIALAFVTFALLAAAAGLRWWAPAPAQAPAPLAVPSLDAARLERPFAVPTPAGAPDAAELSFPPVEVAPGPGASVPPTRATARSRASPAPRAVSAAPRPAPKPREIRETISPPAAACTSNMAALGFCTLPPASTEE